MSTRLTKYSKHAHGRKGTIITRHGKNIPLSLSREQKLTVINGLNKFRTTHMNVYIGGFTNTNPMLRTTVDRSKHDWEQFIYDDDEVAETVEDGFTTVVRDNCTPNHTPKNTRVTDEISNTRISNGETLFEFVESPVAGYIECSYLRYRHAEVLRCSKKCIAELARKMNTRSIHMSFLQPDSAIQAAIDEEVWQPLRLPGQVQATPSVKPNKPYRKKRDTRSEFSYGSKTGTKTNATEISTNDDTASSVSTLTPTSNAWVKAPTIHQDPRVTSSQKQKEDSQLLNHIEDMQKSIS